MIQERLISREPAELVLVEAEVIAYKVPFLK